MHRFDPTKSYRGFDEFGNTAFAIAEMHLLDHQFYEAMGRPLKIQPRSQITIALTMEQLEYVLEHMPDAFGDVPPTSVAEMSDKEREQHEDFLAALKDPGSHAAKFAAWFSNR
ncbi:hypothetical protein QZM03_00980 [Burkholderia multivorans]|nr:hypothetical protein [Burkholderia multivorans]